VSGATNRLDLAGAAADLIAFDALARQDDAAALEVLVDLYRAPLLEGWTDDWVLPERPQEALIATLKEALRERELLLLLDNCELRAP
jgi:hypothetical protein